MWIQEHRVRVNKTNHIFADDAQYQACCWPFRSEKDHQQIVDEIVENDAVFELICVLSRFPLSRSLREEHDDGLGGFRRRVQTSTVQTGLLRDGRMSAVRQNKYTSTYKYFNVELINKELLLIA